MKTRFSCEVFDIVIVGEEKVGGSSFTFVVGDVFIGEIGMMEVL